MLYRSSTAKGSTENHVLTAKGPTALKYYEMCDSTAYFSVFQSCIVCVLIPIAIAPAKLQSSGFSRFREIYRTLLHVISEPTVDPFNNWTIFLLV